ncbi:MAG: hypothetical protein AAF629_29365 [Chloroflexota bacterium]
MNVIKDDKQKQILEAAIDLFAKDGTYPSYSGQFCDSVEGYHKVIFFELFGLISQSEWLDDNTANADDHNN